MIAPLILGGPLSIVCPTCFEERGNECRTRPGSRGGFHTTTPHLARSRAAMPKREALAGDLVLVRHRGEHVAQIVDIGVVLVVLVVRFWRPSVQAFGAPRLLEREAVIALAPDDARTTMAREELRLEVRRHNRAAMGAVLGELAEMFETGPPTEAPALHADIAEGRGPFDPGHGMSDPSPAAADKPRDPWFTSESAETTARKDW